MSGRPPRNVSFTGAVGRFSGQPNLEGGRPPVLNAHLYTPWGTLCVNRNSFGGRTGRSMGTPFGRKPGPPSGFFSAPLVVPLDRVPDVGLAFQLVPDAVGGAF